MTMKTTLAIVASILSAASVTAQLADQFFCGEQGCIVPLKLSCEDMIEQYEFQGSCCSMESIPETKGCRITVLAEGNCYWSPRCGVPLAECQFDDQIRCHTIFETANTDACPRSDFDPLGANATAANATANCPPTSVPIDVNTGSEPTAAPSAATPLAVRTLTIAASMTTVIVLLMGLQ